MLSSSWILSALPVLALSLACALLLRRRAELKRFSDSVRELSIAKEHGSHAARLQHPNIDLSKCIGCGLCVAACPEDGVLDIVYGQAVVVHGARCVGHARCAEACPAAAIAVTLGDLSKRRDLPAVQADFEAVGVPGLFLAGEITGFALVRTAVTQGVAVADAVARRLAARPNTNGKSAAPLDLLIVGSGPAGVACALRAKELGIPYQMIDQAERLGGTVACYPRRKMVMTQPVDLPLHGRLPRLTYQKEELIDLWYQLKDKHGLPIETGVRVAGVARRADGLLAASTSIGNIVAKNICLALGRRGTPRKLGIPGEELPKVSYSLLDVESYRDLNILVVGGGDSAVEAAVGLSSQPGNRVTLSYRKKAFFRLKSRNIVAIENAIQRGQLDCIFESEPTEIREDAVVLAVGEGERARTISIPNGEVFIFAGGIPPFELLEKAGVSFDPADRPAVVETVDKGTGLLVPLCLALACAIGMMVWTHWYGSYYELGAYLRAMSPMHDYLRPAGPFGLVLACLACALFIWNLLYLVRRSLRWGSFLGGSLKVWMGSHVFTGLFALLCVLAHSGFTIKNTSGGHALIALFIVVIAGSIGRYLYAFVPRAVNGAEANLDTLRSELAALSADWDRSGRNFGVQVRREIDRLAGSARWRGSFFERIYALINGQFRLRRLVRELREEARRESVPDDEARHFLDLARNTYRLTLQTSHFEDIRAILATWRYYHRWLAVLMVLLALIHIYVALRFADLAWLGHVTR
ncbi:MAG: NAD(P)-binding domain-containing protein [Candidatus Hydrogenedentes bacterium]|nr:NAD(P)-binding domain-containing protein [Candidatus Hydrogenedentota bacterium]